MTRESGGSLQSRPTGVNRGHPNFLIFVTDQMQSACLGCNGNEEIRTPHIDGIARDGVNFRRAYCNNPVCMPSRATMLTGLTPRQHGCITNGTVLPENIPTITGALAQAGYRTHAVGKLHLGPFAVSEWGEDQPAPASWESLRLWQQGRIAALPRPYYGFQSADYVGGHVDYCFGDYANWLDSIQSDARSLYRREKACHVAEQAPSCWHLAVPEELHYNSWIAERSLAFLESLSREQPFFLWCSFPDPHFPFAACRPYSEMYDPGALAVNPTWRFREDPCARLAAARRSGPQAANFDDMALREIIAQTYGMITHVDNSIGRVLDYLAQRGIYDQTVIVFVSDHGEYLGSHGLLYKGLWPWEELLRIPFIWKGIDGGRPRGEFGGIVSMLDLAPTILDYAGIDQTTLDLRRTGGADRAGLPGRSLKPFLEAQGTLPPRCALIEYDEDASPGPMTRMRAIVDDEFKLALYAVSGGALLYALGDDPHETRNVVDSPAYLETRLRLTHQLLEMIAWSDRLDQPRLSGA